jgi:hypothetical protein
MIGFIGYNMASRHRSLFLVSFPGPGPERFYKTLKNIVYIYVIGVQSGLLPPPQC